jgi:hypothetical protein
MLARARFRDCDNPNNILRQRAMSQKYPLSAFLTGKIDQKAHSRWLSRRSIAHVKRDKKRGNTTALNEAYKKTIHLAAVDSAGLDEYTEETLDWHLVSTYDNDKSKTHRRKYKSLFALLPTVDHIDDGLGEPSFKICGWRTNDAKCDLSSRPEGFHLRALPEPCVTLSSHTAPDVRPLP